MHMEKLMQEVGVDRAGHVWSLHLHLYSLGKDLVTWSHLTEGGLGSLT